MASQEGCLLQLLSLVAAPKILRAPLASLPPHFSQSLPAQNALTTESSNERRARFPRSWGTMKRKGISEEENDAFKQCAEAEDLLVLGARALIGIGRG